METFVKKVEELIQVGWNIKEFVQYRSWNKRVTAFLQSAIDDKTSENFAILYKEGSYGWEQYRETQIGHLEGLALRIESKSLSSEIKESSKNKLEEQGYVQTKKVFIVHGHDSETKESVARFIEKLDLSPIILHEQPNSGKTIIEKFEVFSDVGFAVILLTPDDVGASSLKQDKLKARSRQNVILELGYFMGKLGRRRVCPLYKRGVEIPSDYQGVLYTEIDDAGAWKTKLAQELVQAGFSIDLKALLQG